jgi:CubicO group peptidase (beta-lactamase class C family)
MVEDLRDRIDALAASSSFSGLVAVDQPDGMTVRAHGEADRAHDIANTPETRFAIASGAKGLTALAVMSLVDEGRLELSTPVRSILGTDLPLVQAEVTIEHLLAHRSGIGDYFDEENDAPIDAYALAVPPHELDSIEAYLPVLDGYPQKFPPDERFSYCNGGFVILALVAERVAGKPFSEVVTDRVCGPAGMSRTTFLRTDELPGDVAVGYLQTEGLRSNVLHLPVLGGGDGGAYSTVADISALWRALFDGRIVAPATVAEMTRARSDVPSDEARYGLGFWLHGSRDIVELHGYDTGISFHSSHEPVTHTTLTVVSNTSEGAWGIVEDVAALVFGGG